MTYYEMMCKINDDIKNSFDTIIETIKSMNKSNINKFNSYDEDFSKQIDLNIKIMNKLLKYRKIIKILFLLNILTLILSIVGLVI